MQNADSHNFAKKVLTSEPDHGILNKSPDDTGCEKQRKRAV